MIAQLVAVVLAAGEGDGSVPADAPVADVVIDAAPTVETSAEKAGEKAGEKAAPSQFVKGELSVYLGSDRLVVKNNRVGVSIGVDQLGPTYYLLLEPNVDLRFLDGKLGIGLGVPLRLELVNFGNDATGKPILASNFGQLRKEDYNSVHDFGRLLKYVTYGRKEDNLYISAGQRYASSIGHGALVRRYAPNVDINYPRASAQVDAYNQYGGFEFLTNDLLAWNTLAAMVFAKPLSFLKSDNLLANSFSIGVSGAFDLTAPQTLKTDADGFRLLDADGRLQSINRAVKLIGFDAEVKVVKTESVDVKPYVDYSMFLGGDGGFTAGVLGRFNVGKDTVNAFRVVAEVRALGSRYVPSYFDTFYEVERFVSKELERTNPDVARFATKQEAVLAGYGNRVGYYVEGSWGIPGKVGLTLALEGVSNSPATNFVAHLEVPVLDFVQVFGSYYKRGMTSPAALFALDLNTVLYAGARLKILPFLFVNGRLYKTFRMNPELQRYDNLLGFVVDVEIGFEFKGKQKAPPPKETPGETPATDAPAADAPSPT